VIRVFDASALIAWLKHEPGAAATRDLLRDASSPRYAHAVNLCEVYYHFVKLAEEESVAARLRMLARSGLVTRDDIDADFWQDAARVKAAIQRVSLADCFAIAFARRVGGTVVTADHGEFDLVVARGICSVTFIR
jgi:predicted nucleic acid-binding protein